MIKEKEKIYKLHFLNKYYKYTKFIEEQCLVDFNNITDILPESKLSSFEKDILILEEKVDILDKKANFIEKYKKYTEMFSKVVCPHVNKIALKAFIENEKNESVKKTLKSFKATEKTSYDLLNNVTGRLVVKDGPSILTLPKKYRSILKSRFDKGHIISIDFSSLEPRLCLKLSNKETSKDLYEEINEMLDLNLNRSVIKRAIISVLYGAHYTSLKDISEVKSKALFECIREYFDLNNILKMSKNIDEHGIRRNTEGRPLWNLEEEKENILINNFIQSSAVDIALGYFSNLSNLINKEESVILFVLHDAVILDVKDSYLNSIKEIAEKGYNHPTLGNFPLKLETFNNISRINNEY